MKIDLSKEYNIHRIISYIRKSRKDEERERKTNEDTLAEQTKLMKRILNEYGIPYELKLELGSGDKISTRPVFQEVLEELRLGNYQAVAVKELPRLGRGSYSDMGTIYDLLIEKRIYIITPWKIYDPTNSADQRQIRFELFLSREEFETTRERLIGGRYNLAMQGRYMLGRKTYGYEFNPKTQKLVPNEDEAQIIKLIFSLYAYGQNGQDFGVHTIARYLKSLGIKTSKGKTTWGHSVVSKMLKNPVYIGTIRFRLTQVKNGKRYERPESEHIIVENAHEPLVDIETWDIVQDKLSGNKPVASVNLNGKTPTYSLTGLITCSQCGYRAVVNSYNRTRTKNGKEYSYHETRLKCAANRCWSVAYKRVEDRVVKAIKELSEMDLDKFKLALETISKRAENEIEKDQSLTIVQSIEKQKKDLESRREFIYKQYELEIYTSEEFIERRNKVQNELDKLNQIVLPKSNKSTKDISDEDTIEIQDQFKTVYDNYIKYGSTDDVIFQNRLLKTLFDKIDLIMIEKGAGRHRHSKFDLEPVLSSTFLY